MHLIACLFTSWGCWVFLFFPFFFSVRVSLRGRVRQWAMFRVKHSFVELNVGVGGKLNNWHVKSLDGEGAWFDQA